MPDIDSLRSGSAKFEDLAKTHSQDTATKAAGCEIEGWVSKGAFIRGIGQSDAETAAVFDTEKGQVAAAPVKSDKGFHVIRVRDRRPQRQKPFDEVRDEVFRELRMRKETDVREALLAELRSEYDVVIHHTPFRAAPVKGDAKKK